MNNKKLFTHTDLDGVSCAILAKLAWKEMVDIEFCNYNDVDEKVLNFFESKLTKTYETVYITDISVKDSTAQRIDGQARIRLLDHHQTALELNRYPWATVDISQCGTKLFYEHLTGSHKLKSSKTLDMFVEYVNSYDTWEWKQNNKREPKLLNDISYILGRDEFIKTYVEILMDESNLLPDKFVELVKEQDIKDEYMSNKLKEVITYSLYEPNIDDYYTAGYVACDKFEYLSELGSTICTMIEKCDFSVINTGKNLSLRSAGDMDVSRIAKKYGGGGHKAAAGCPIEELLKDLLNNY
jgi:oligoribonuclease NrnB/cAMP/cGMP phosphodiesterase (DHH superfamily)